MNPGQIHARFWLRSALHLLVPGGWGHYRYLRRFQDASFDVDALFAEHARTIKPGGFALYDLPVADRLLTGPFESVAWTNTEELIPRILAYFDRLVLQSREGKWMWVLVQGPKHS